MTAKSVVAEYLGTAALLMAIVGSGITASNGGAGSAQLFQHAAAVGFALAALILTFGPVSGGHFNPLVTLADLAFGGVSRRVALAYMGAQLAGAVSGVVGANLLFDRGAVSVSTAARGGIAASAGEAVATFGLLVVIFGVVRSGRINAVPAAVGAWVGSAIYFTPSAAFANPAVTLARMLTDSYTGIAPDSIPSFLTGQLVGAGAALLTIRYLFTPSPSDAGAVVVPHSAPVGEAAGRPRPPATSRDDIGAQP